jgi:WD40 repeat protein
MASNNEAVDSVAISNVTNENTNNSVPSRDDQEPRGEAIVGDLQRRRPLSKMMRQGYILSPEKQSTSPLQNNYQTEMCFGFSLMPSRSARFAKRLERLKGPSLFQDSRHVGEGSKIPKNPVEPTPPQLLEVSNNQSERKERNLTENNVVDQLEVSSEDAKPQTIVHLPGNILLEHIAPFIGDRPTWNALLVNRELYALSKRLQQSLYRPWPHVRRSVPSGRPLTVCFGTYYCCCGTDQGKVFVWKLYGSGAPTVLPSLHTERINSVKCVGDWLIEGGDSQVARIWNVETCTCKGVLDGHTSSITCIAVLNLEQQQDNGTSSTLSESSILVATASRDSDIRLHVVIFVANRIASFRPIMTLKSAHRGPVYSIELYQRKGNCYLISGGDDGRLLRWKIGSIKEEICNERASPITSASVSCLLNAVGEIRSVALYEKSEQVAASIRRNVHVVHKNEETALWEFRSLRGHTNDIRSVDFSPCGNILATACSDGSIRLWDLQRETYIRKWIAHNGFMVCCLAFSKDGQSLLSAGSDGVIAIEAV